MANRISLIHTKYRSAFSLNDTQKAKKKENFLQRAFFISIVWQILERGFAKKSFVIAFIKKKTPHKTHTLCFLSISLTIFFKRLLISRIKNSFVYNENLLMNPKSQHRNWMGEGGAEQEKDF